MSTVKSALAQKRGALTHVRSGDMVVEALRQMRENRVRSVLVIDDDVLVGIVTQGLTEEPRCRRPVRDPAAALVLLQLKAARRGGLAAATRRVVFSSRATDFGFSPAPAASFFTSAMRQAVAAIARFTVIGCHRLVK